MHQLAATELKCLHGHCLQNKIATDVDSIAVRIRPH